MKWKYNKPTKTYYLRDENNEAVKSVFALGYGFSATEELIDHRIKWKNKITQDRNSQKKKLPSITKVDQSFTDIKKTYQKQKILDESVK